MQLPLPLPLMLIAIGLVILLVVPYLIRVPDPVLPPLPPADPLDPCFFDSRDPAAWRTELCPELAATLESMIAVHPDLRVDKIGYDNVKMPELIAILDRTPNAVAMAAMERHCRAGAPNLRGSAGGVVCNDHWAGIHWSPANEAEAETPPPA